MLEYGVSLLFFGLDAILSGVPSRLPSRLRRGPTFSYASNGFLNTLLLFAGLADASLWDACVIGEGFLLTGAGWKLSSSTLTKLLGNSPMARGSLRNLPIHQEPSPALRASIRSPSMNPRSFFVSPPHEYVAWHQHGKRAGIGGAPIVSRRPDGCADSWLALQIMSLRSNWSRMAALLCRTIVNCRAKYKDVQVGRRTGQRQMFRASDRLSAAATSAA